MPGLRPRTLAVARAVAATMFDPGTGTPIAEERLDWMTRELHAYSIGAGPRTTNGLTLIMLALQILPFLLIGKLARFTSLSPADRQRYLHRVETSRLFAPLVATSKIVLAMVYFEHPDALRECGVNVSCLHPPRESAPLPLRTGGAA